MIFTGPLKGSGKAVRGLVRHTAALLAVWLLSLQVQAQDNEAMPWFRETPDRDKYLLILAGPGATPEAQQRFADWATRLDELGETTLGYPPENITLLSGEGSGAAFGGERVDGGTNRDVVRARLDSLTERAREGDQLTIVLLGHGSGRFGEARFNNAGPDITASQFAAWLDAFEGVDLAVINTTSASYPFSEALSRPGRVIISATRSRAERYDTRFPAFLIAALEEHAADVDRNGQLSLLEVFNFARRSVTDWYEEEGRLATEHAVIDDTGDGNFVAEPEPREGDGLLSQVAYIDTVQRTMQDLSPDERRLRTRMQELEREVVLLRGRKSDYLESEYWQRMETLLVDLARTTRRFDDQ